MSALTPTIMTREKYLNNAFVKMALLSIKEATGQTIEDISGYKTAVRQRDARNMFVRLCVTNKVPMPAIAVILDISKNAVESALHYHSIGMKRKQFSRDRSDYRYYKLFYQAESLLSDKFKQYVKDNYEQGENKA